MATSARYLCEMEFFTALGISAYLQSKNDGGKDEAPAVRKGSANHRFWNFQTQTVLRCRQVKLSGSDRLRLVISIWLETRVPTEIGGPPRRHNFTLKDQIRTADQNGPRAPPGDASWTLTSVRPLKRCTGWSMPAQKAKVQRAHADLSSNPARSLYKPNKCSTSGLVASLFVVKKYKLL